MKQYQDTTASAAKQVTEEQLNTILDALNQLDEAQCIIEGIKEQGGAGSAALNSACNELNKAVEIMNAVYMEIRHAKCYEESEPCCRYWKLIEAIRRENFTTVVAIGALLGLSPSEMFMLD